MEFTSLLLRDSITINKLFSFHYFEYTKGYLFEGEQHDFWEFLYVDKGEVEVRADDRTVQLSQGMIIFHKPGEFHTVRVSQEHKPPNLIVISFDCNSPYMSRLENSILALEKKERDLLALIVQEGYQTFEPPFDNPSLHRLSPHPRAPFARKQVMKAYLEILLISLLRNEERSGRLEPRKLPSIQKDRADNLIAEQIIAYLKQHIADNLSLNQLCTALHMGKSRLKEIFQAQKGTGAMEYFKKLKIEETKSLVPLFAEFTR